MNDRIRIRILLYYVILPLKLLSQLIPLVFYWSFNSLSQESLKVCAMLARELQKVLAEERAARETIDTGAESVRREWNQYQTSAERRERELSNTVESLRRKLKREKESATPLLSTLQDEMASMKQQHSIALLKVRHLSCSAY